MKQHLLAFAESVFRGILIAQIALLNYPAMAKASGPTVAQRQRMVADAALDYVANQSTFLHTPARFKETYLDAFQPEDAEEIYAKIRQLKALPKLHKEGSKIVMKDGYNKLEIEWPDPTKLNFKINGLTFAYDQTKHLVPQFEAFRKQAKAKDHASFWFRAMLPEAHAQVGIWEVLLFAVLTGLIGTAISVAFGQIIQLGVCSLGINSGDCIALRAKRNQLTRKFKFDAVKNLTATDKKSLLGKFEGQDWTCPADNDGKEREYRGRLRDVEAKDGKRVPIGDGAWIDVLVKMTPDGTATDYIFVDGGSGDPAKINTTSTEGAKHLVVHVIDGTAADSIPIYRVPDPDRITPAVSADKPGVTGKPHRKVSVATPTKNLNRMQTSTAEEEKQMDHADDMINFLNFHLYKCVEEKATADVIAGVDPGSPAEPKKDPATNK